MREYFRPYNKVVDVTTFGQYNVSFTDSSGGPLLCNYVSVVCVSSSQTEGYADNMFQVVPSGIDTMYGSRSGHPGGTWDTNPIMPVGLSGRDRGPSGYTDASSRTSNSASGNLGLVGNAETDTLIMSVNPSEAMTGIILTQSTATARRYSVTYGQVNLANSNSDIYKDSGEQTGSWEGP